MCRDQNESINNKNYYGRLKSAALARESPTAGIRTLAEQPKSRAGESDAITDRRVPGSVLEIGERTGDLLKSGNY